MALEHDTMSRSTTAYVAAEVRAELGRQDRENAWLARELNVSEMWVSRRLRCVTEFSADDVVQIATVLGVPPANLMPAAALTPAGVA